MLNVTDENFAEHVNTGNVLFMFRTTWCSLCPPIVEILDDLEQSAGSFKFVAIDFDENPNAVCAYNIPGVPIVLAIKDGVVLEGWGGLTDADAYRKIVDDLFS